MKTATLDAASSMRQPLLGRLYVHLQPLRGKPLGQFLRRLRELERLSPAEFDLLHEQRLESVLDYARTHVPLYRTGAWQTALAEGRPGLDHWPVLERDTLRSCYGELLAQPSPGRIVTHGTSGSTGTPVKIAFTRHSDTWGWAHRAQGLLWHGVPIGVPALRLLLKRRRWRDFLLGQKSFPVLDTTAVEQAISYLRDARPALVMGSPSALFYLARCMRERGCTGPLAPFARVGGEQLFPFQRVEIEQFLAARAVDSYGCTEIGALAGECPAGSMHIYADHVHIEIFAGDAPVPPGEFGDVVLTAMANPAMPLVRYRVGDQARLSPDRCSCGLPHPVLLDLRPRSDDRFAAIDGRLRHGAELVEKLDGFFADAISTGVRQVQFEQEGPRSWRVAVALAEQAHATANSNETRPEMEQFFTRLVREKFGADCDVGLQIVTSIPTERGKFRYYRTGPRTST